MISYIEDFLDLAEGAFSTDFTILLLAILCLTFTFAILKVILIWLERLFS